MTDTSRLRLESVPRPFAVLAAAVLFLSLIPLAGTAGAQAVDDDEVVITAGDGLVPSARFAGLNRYDTAQRIATDTTPFAADFDGDAVILATGERFPDALAGSTLGGLENAPIVLTPRFTEPDGELNEFTAEALDDFGDDLETVYILGGVEAIAEDVEAKVAEDYDVDIVRFPGIDRHETAALIADETADELDDDETRTAIVARSGDFADALVAGSIAAAENLPLLLTPTEEPINEFTSERLESLGIERILFAGGTEALTQDAEDALEDEGYDVVRLGGFNRYDTAVRFAEFAEDEFGFGTDHANLARGDEFPDALALGPHAGLDFGGPAPILLTRPTELPEETRGYFESIGGCDFTALHVAGGILAITEDVEDEAREALTAIGDACIVILTPESATNEVGETHTVTATVVDNGGGPLGEPTTVTFTAEAAPGSLAQPTPETATVETDEDGTASFSFTSFTPGEVIITASVFDSEGIARLGAAVKTFTVPLLTDDLGETTTALGLTSVGGAARLIVESFDPVLDPGVTPPVTTFDEQYLIVDDDTGLPLVGETLVGLDSVNPLYALGADGTLYTLEVTDDTDFVDLGTGDTLAGVVTATDVGTGDFGDAQLGIVEGSGVGFDFNTTADAFRVVNQEGRNFTLDDDDATATRQADLAYAAGDVNEGTTPGVSAAAYTVNDVLYVLDTVNDVLAIQAPPNNGTLNTVADLTFVDEFGDVGDVNITGVNGFDVDRATNQAYVALEVVDPFSGEVTGVYTLDLGTGELRPVSTGDTVFNGLTFGDLPVAD